MIPQPGGPVPSVGIGGAILVERDMWMPQDRGSADEGSDILVSAGLVRSGAAEAYIVVRASPQQVEGSQVKPDDRVFFARMCLPLNSRCTRGWILRYRIEHILIRRI